MALNATRLASNKATNDRWITLVNPNCVERNMLALVDQEWMLIGNTIAELIGTSPPRPTVGVVPGYDGTPAGPHAQQATAIVGRPNDFQTIGLIPGSVVMSQSFSGLTGAWQSITGPSGLDGSTPIANTVVNLVGPDTTNYFQLSAPTPDQTNTMVLVSGPGGTSNLHFAPGFGGNPASPDAGIPPGAVLVLQARGGTWMPVASADGGASIF